MSNRYPGQCNECGSKVRKGAGVAVKAASGRWIVLCAAHSGASSSGTAAGRVSDHFEIGGRSYYRNTRGRCEDAPCCGCCTI